MAASQAVAKAVAAEALHLNIKILVQNPRLPGIFILHNN